MTTTGTITTVEKPADLLLLFPPITEARQLPYLSLPQLTGYLLTRGHRVVQHDLNIALCRQLFVPEQLEAAAATADGTAVKRAFTRLQAAFFAREAGTLGAIAFDKAPPGAMTPDRAIRLVQRGLELVLGKSQWYGVPETLAELESRIVEVPAEPVSAVTHQIVAEALDRHRPAVVGISVPFFSQLAPSLSIASWVKRLLPSALVILGGQQIMLRAQQLARLDSTLKAVDALCTGPGEEPLDALLRGLAAGRPAATPGLTWLSRESSVAGTPKLRFRGLPPPDFTGLPIRHYLVDNVRLPIATCMGCYWGRCVFCAYGNRSLSPGGYQQASPEQIADWIASSVRRWGVSDLVVADENTNLRLLVRGLRLARDRGLRVTVQLRNRLEPALLDLDFCRELAELGCVSMSCGYESNSQRLLDKMDKGIDASTYQQIIDNLDNVGIALRFSVMGGLFDETHEEAANSREFLVENANKIGLDVLQMLVVEPGSVLASKLDGFNLAALPGKLQGNPEFSYLGGRVGSAFEYLSGSARGDRAADLMRVYQEVKPARNIDLPPHLRSTAAVAMQLSSRLHKPRLLRLHSWVQPLAVPGKDVLLADLEWARVFRLPAQAAYDKNIHAIHVPMGGNLADDLLAAGLGWADAGEGEQCGTE
jgi:anaerobic magnesium-protoporphyrin IX monomethyl ester cyclase